jgi:hypothetical protein
LISGVLTGCHGGGAGGMVVLQGRNVSVTGQLFANGGGGGGGKPDTGDTARGGRAPDGPISVACASGGTSSSNGGVGGTGGCKAMNPGPGGKCSPMAGRPSVPSAGGGGGSTGLLFAYTPAGVMPVLTPSAASPNFEAAGTVDTH